MVSYQDGASSRMAKLRNSRIPSERRQRQATFAELVCAYEYGRLDDFHMVFLPFTSFLSMNKSWAKKLLTRAEKKTAFGWK